jgi:hypothetical protein
MADILLHPATRKNFEARRFDLNARIRAVVMLSFEDCPPFYQDMTAENGQKFGLAPDEMHRRGIENFVRDSCEELQRIEKRLEVACH